MKRMTVSKRILEALSEGPLSTKAVIAAVGSSYAGTLLSIMADRGLIEVAGTGRYNAKTWRITDAGRRLAVADPVVSVAARRDPEAAALSAANRAAVLRALAQRPEGMTSGVAARCTGVSRVQAARSLRTLTQMGLAARIYPDRSRPRWSITEAGMREAVLKRVRGDLREMSS